MDDKHKKIKEAIARRQRQKEKPDTMNQYYAVIAFFCASMLAALVYTLMNPAQSFAEMPVIDESAMLVHNGQGNRFQQGPNEFFQDWTIADAKKLFETGLSDNPNIEPCKSGQNFGMEIPESYDWREQYPECVQEPHPVQPNCTASYAVSTIQAAEDRICATGKREQVRLSVQELIDCDKNTECLAGTVNKVLAWGKRRGFLPEECYPTKGKKGQCPAEHLKMNECRTFNNYYRAVDFCIAQEVDGIKREIMTNGPVLAQMNPFTDMLTYSEGVYQSTNEAFKFNGNHVFKVVGWESSPDGTMSWIVQNTWGSDWGENGYARIASGNSIMLDFYAIGFVMYPAIMDELYDQKINEAKLQEQLDELESDIEQIFLDEEVVEEGIDQEL